MLYSGIPVRPTPDLIIQVGIFIFFVLVTCCAKSSRSSSPSDSHPFILSLTLRQTLDWSMLRTRHLCVCLTHLFILEFLPLADWWGQGAASGASQSKALCGVSLACVSASTCSPVIFAAARASAVLSDLEAFQNILSRRFRSSLPKQSKASLRNHGGCEALSQGLVPQVPPSHPFATPVPRSEIGGTSHPPAKPSRLAGWRCLRGGGADLVTRSPERLATP